MQAESSMKMEQNDATIRSYLGIENAKMASSRSAIPSGSPALEKAFSSEEPMDPRDFTRSVLEQCNAVQPVTSQRRPILHRGSSIERICNQNPSYAKAFSKTVYGK